MRDDMPTYASALAYHALFSLFPFTLVLITLMGFLHLPQVFDWLQTQAFLLLPAEARDVVLPVIRQLKEQKAGLLLLVAALMVTGPEIMRRLAARLGLEQVVVTLWAWLCCCSGRNSTPSSNSSNRKGGRQPGNPCPAMRPPTTTRTRPSTMTAAP